MLAGVRDWPSQIPYREAAPSTIKPLRRPARSVPGILSLDGLAELETERHEHIHRRPAGRAYAQRVAAELVRDAHTSSD
jgi:hypothetical protein